MIAWKPFEVQLRDGSYLGVSAREPDDKLEVSIRVHWPSSEMTTIDWTLVKRFAGSEVLGGPHWRLEKDMNAFLSRQISDILEGFYKQYVASLLERQK